MNNYKNIAIVGSGMSAWMICAFVSHQLRNTDTRITLHTGVVSEESEMIQSPLPMINTFFNTIGIKPEQYQSALKPKGKLGTAFFFEHENPFFHTWGNYCDSKGVVEPHQILLRYIQLAGEIDLNKLSIASASVLGGRFKPSSYDQKSIFSTYESSWSFETSLFINLLQSVCEKNDVLINSDALSGVKTGGVASEVTDTKNNVIKYDFLINTVKDFVESDCLETLHSVLPFRSTVRIGRGDSSLSTVNKVKIINGQSWVKEISHADSIIGRVWSFSEKDSHENYMCIKPRSAHSLNFGEALAGFCSPVSSQLDINLIVIDLLERYFPSHADCQHVTDEFNNTLLLRIRNLVDVNRLVLYLLFKKFNPTHTGLSISERSLSKIKLFKKRGRLPVFDDEFYKSKWQVWLLIGLGVRPENVEPLTVNIDGKEIKRHVEKVEKSILSQLMTVPMA